MPAPPERCTAFTRVSRRSRPMDVAGTLSQGVVAQWSSPSMLAYERRIACGRGARDYKGLTVMGFRFRISRLSLAGAILALWALLFAACGAPSADPPSSAPSPDVSLSSTATAPVATSTPADTVPPAEPSAIATPQPAAPTVIPTPIVPIGAGGIIAVGSGANRISVLREGAWLAPPGIDLGGCLATGAVFSRGENDAWVGCNRLLRTTDGGATWNVIASDLSLPQVIVLDGQGRIWWIEMKRITVLDAENGTVINVYTAADATGEEQFPSEAAIVTADGVLWLGGLNTSGSELVSFDGTTWTAFGESETLGIKSFESPRAFLAHSDGRVLTVTSSNLYTINDGKLSPLIPAAQASSFPGTVTHMIELPGDVIAMASFTGVFTWDGSVLNTRTDTSTLPSSKINWLTVDVAGRLWVATDYGIAVSDSQGVWQSVTPANSGLADSRIAALAVIGAPALPAPETEKTTSVSGRIIAASGPVGDTTVELCAESAKMAFRETPCEGQAFALRVKTNADGRFRFDNVPLGSLSLAAQQADGQWIIFLDTITALDPAQDVELGDVNLDR